MSARPKSFGNLTLDGYQRTASRIASTYARCSATVLVLVDDAGRTFATTRRVTEAPQHHRVGTYTSQGMVDEPEVLEGDLLVRMQELTWRYAA